MTKETNQIDTLISESGYLLAGDSVFDLIFNFIRRFVVLTKYQATVITIWIIHTYLFDNAETTLYLHISSAEKQSGKTRLLEVLELLVNKPWFTGRTTVAALARKIDAECPTLLLDESDTAFKIKGEYSEILRSILNSGYRFGGKSTLCIIKGKNYTYIDLSTFCPKAIAGIGKLPDTVSDRSVDIVMKRRSLDEPVEKFRRREVIPLASYIKNEIVHWLPTITISDQYPFIPEQLSDRAADCWEPLFVIADIIGGEVPELIRKAAIELMTGENHQDDSTGVILLSIIYEIIKDIEQIPSDDLVSQINQQDDIPVDHLTPRILASLLKPYGIKSKTIRTGDRTVKGYRKADLFDAFKRYIPNYGLRNVTSVTLASEHPDFEANEDPSQMVNNDPKIPNVTDNSQARSTLNVTDVTDKTPENETWRMDL